MSDEKRKPIGRIMARLKDDREADPVAIGAIWPANFKTERRKGDRLVGGLSLGSKSKDGDVLSAAEAAKMILGGDFFVDVQIWPEAFGEAREEGRREKTRTARKQKEVEPKSDYSDDIPF